MFQSAKNALGANERRDGSRSRSRFDYDKIECSIKRQSGTAGFAPKVLLDGACHAALEGPPKWGDTVELVQNNGSRIPVPIFLVMRAYAERNLAHARRRDRLMENWRIVSAMHATGC
jgi:hypothetical protein